MEDDTKEEEINHDKKEGESLKPELEPELHPPKHLAWIVVATIALMLLLVGVLAWTTYRSTGQWTLQTYLPTGKPSQPAVTNTVTKDEGTWHREPLAGLEFKYDPATTKVFGYSNRPDEATTATGPVNDPTKVEIGVDMVDLGKYIKTDTMPENLQNIIDNLSGKQSTAKIITNANGIKFMELSELDPGIGCNIGWVTRRNDLLIHIYTWTVQCETYEPKVDASVVASTLRSAIDSVRYVSVTDEQKNLTNLDEYHIYDTSTTKAVLTEQKQDCDVVKVDDVTGDGNNDLIMQFSGCGSSTSYPVVLTMHNGHLQDYYLAHPDTSYTGPTSGTAGPDTGLAILDIENGKINLVVPVHSEADDCHTCITGGVESMWYKWTKDGFVIDTYNYNPDAPSPL